MYYQFTEYYDSIGHKKIPCRCPKCGTKDSLELEFFQKRIVTGFSEKVTKKVTAILFCHHTQTEIPPVLWTDDIENYFKTEKPKLKLNPTKFKLTKWFYIVICLLALFILGLVGYMFYEKQQQETQKDQLEKISSGVKIKVMYSQLEDHKLKAHGNTWFIVKKVAADTVWLQRNKDFNAEENFNFDLQDANFNDETIKVSFTKLKERGIFAHDYRNYTFSGFITEIE